MIDTISANLKTPFTRLLDLTAGWSQFVDREQEGLTAGEGPEEESWSDPDVSVEDLCDLYQAAGNLIGINESLSPEEEAQRVRAFVAQRILPLLLRETPHKKRFLTMTDSEVVEPVAA